MEETTEPTTQDSSAGAGADHLASLIGDALPPASEPSTPSEPTTPTRDATGRFVKDGAEPTTAPPTEGEPPASPTPAPPARFKIGDREYTDEELQAALTTAQQFPHLQKKYTEVLEQQRQAAQPAQQPQQPQRTPQQVMADLKHRYGEELSGLVASGLIEADAAELYPGLIMQGLYLRDWISNVAREFVELKQHVGGFTGKASAKDTMGEVNAALDLIAAEDGIYKGLGDPEKDAKGQTARDRFLRYLADEINPTTDKLTGEFLKRMWLAHNGDALVTMARQSGEATQRAEAASRARAAGDGRAARPSAPAPAAKSPMETVIDRLTEGVLPR